MLGKCFVIAGVIFLLTSTGMAQVSTSPSAAPSTVSSPSAATGPSAQQGGVPGQVQAINPFSGIPSQAQPSPTPPASGQSAPTVQQGVHPSLAGQQGPQITQQAAQTVQQQLQQLTPQQAQTVVQGLSAEQQQQFIQQLPPQYQTIVQQMSLQQQMQFLQQMSLQQQMQILQRLPAQAQQDILQKVQPARSTSIQVSPEQKAALQSELAKTGGVLTPEALNALQQRAEFKGLAVEDLMKMKQAIDAQKEGGPQTTGASPPVSLFERYRLVSGYQDISTAIAPFGAKFFQDAALGNTTERKDVPVPSKYVIGPGDEIKVLFWGRVNNQYTLVVDRNGNITIPQVGPVHVAGLTFEDMSVQLIKRAEAIVGGNIDVTMGVLKTIPIFVLGDVRRPGSYTVGSFATITDALLIAGGPSDIGSMRNVQLRRADKVIAKYDLYDLLIKGDKSKDTVLQAGDIVFVPVTGPLVGIAGNVKRPAIYELKDHKDLQSLIDLAGDIMPTGYTQQIQVERIIRNEKHTIVDINDKNLSKLRTVQLQDGDLVKVFNIVDRNMNTVYLNGNVKRPGKYEFRAGMRVTDVILGAGDLLPQTDYDYALIRRLKPPLMEVELIPFNLAKAIQEKDKEHNKELKSQDTILVFSKWEFQEQPFITVEGEVRNPGRLDLLQNMTIKDAILSSGGLTLQAYYKYGELYRTDKETRKVSLIKFDPKKVLEGNPQQNLSLKTLDRIVIHSVLGFEYQRTVSVDGEVFKPGDYRYAQNMTVKDLVLAAGNVKEGAYLNEAEISSRIVEGDKVTRIEHRKINLGEALKGDTEHNITLKPYDRLFVKPLTDWGRERFVTINGQVMFPGKYILNQHERLSDLIERAGGYKEKAYLRGAVFTRTSVQVQQQKNLDEMVTRLQNEVLASGTAYTGQDGEAKKVEMQQKQALVESLKTVKATGRMAINLAHPRILKNSAYDVELEDGDSLYIPMNPKVVNVMGAVMSNTSVIYSDNFGYKDYIQKAGGYSKWADKPRMYVLKVDGSARQISRGMLNWSDSRERWEVAGFTEVRKEIEPGDTIVVPENLDRWAWLRPIKDITQILSQVAVSAGAVYLFSNR